MGYPLPSQLCSHFLHSRRVLNFSFSNNFQEISNLDQFGPSFIFHKSFFRPPKNLSRRGFAQQTLQRRSRCSIPAKLRGSAGAARRFLRALRRSALEQIRAFCSQNASKLLASLGPRYRHGRRSACSVEGAKRPKPRSVATIGTLQYQN